MLQSSFAEYSCLTFFFFFSFFFGVTHENRLAVNRKSPDLLPRHVFSHKAKFFVSQVGSKWFSHGNVNFTVNDVIRVSEPRRNPDSRMCEVIIGPVGLNSGVQQFRVRISTGFISVLYKRSEVSCNWACFPPTVEGQREKQKKHISKGVRRQSKST